MCFRHYLHISNVRHRRALTRILLGCHLLASERLSWSDRYRLHVPRAERLCRLCKADVESPEHALFDCNNCVLMCLCEAFLKDVQLSPVMKDSVNQANTCIAKFHRLLESKLTVSLLAKYCHAILTWFDLFPMYIPNGYVISVDQQLPLQLSSSVDSSET